MTDEKTTPEIEEPKATEGEQDVEGHKIPREGSGTGSLDGRDQQPAPDELLRQ